MGERTAWRPFLELWSQEWIAGHEPGKDAPLAEEVVRDGWLGFGPASEAEVAAAESRLRCELPPSLREFLLTTNGWRDAGTSIYRLAGTAELQWLRDTEDGHWIEVYEDLAREDADGFGVEEARILARCLRLSLEGDAAVMLLDPGDVDEHGEWAGYWLASWSGEGPERYGSFHDLMRDQWTAFHFVLKPPGPTRDHWDAEVEQARRAALDGEVVGPLLTFADAHDFGRQRADVLSMQMKALLGDWRHEVLQLLWYNTPALDEVLLGPLFATELLPLLMRHDRLAARHELRPRVRMNDHAPQAVRALVDDYEARSAEPGFRLCFGVPAFDAAVHAIADRGTADEAAWLALREAMRLWRPLCEDHIAPVSLLAHPVLADLITPERGRELLAMPRG